MSLSLCLIQVSCVSQKPILSKEISYKINKSKDIVLNFTLKSNAQIEPFKEAQKATYIKIVKGNNLVIKIEGLKKPFKNIADSGYREVVYLEIPNKKQSLKNLDLNKSDLNLWFARFCFCRDYIGFHKIKKGQMSLSLNNKSLAIKTTLKFNNLPQVLNFIDQKIPLK